jgi:hypothetical protein
MIAAFVFAGSAFGQSTDYSWTVPVTEDAQRAYTAGHSGARTVDGPYDLDGDGMMEVLVSDYTGGARIHVIESTGPDTWEWVYSTPYLDVDASTNNGRAIAGGDMDGDGFGEMYFFGGAGYAEGSAYPYGLYVFEHTGADNDYGTEPATVYEMPNAPDRWRQEQIVVQDIDNDGVQEMMFGNNASNSDGDNWWIISVSGDIGSGFETWSDEAYIASRSRDWDPVDRGGGSPYGMVAADVDGNGINEIFMSSWNSLNMAIGQATGPNVYFFPDGTTGPQNQQMSAGVGDHVSLFGLDVVDINQDGDDEVFGSVFQTGDVFVVNYELGESTTQITSDNYKIAVAPGLSGLGLTAGDLDGDGNIDLIGTGSSYTAEQFNQGLSPNWVNIVEYIGDENSDPEDPANYSDIVQVFFPNDLADDFDRVTRDSAGVITEYRENGAQGPQFASKFAFLGDVDNDSYNEVALAIQGVDDSLYTYTETFNPADSTYTRELVSVEPGPARVFMRILSAGATGINIQDERVIIPSDYVLEQNYPNPFNPTTNIRFELPRDKAVSLTIFDVSGRVVKRIVDNQHLSQGVHEFQWDGTNAAGGQVASGTYLYQLKFGNFAHTKTMVLLK